MSALCHDVGHTGRTNIFEVNSQSKLALRYHDRSVLEQHHAAVSFKIMHQDSCNVIKNMTQQEFINFRKSFI